MKKGPRRAPVSVALESLPWVVGEIASQIREMLVDAPVDLCDPLPVRERAEQGQREERLCGVIHCRGAMVHRRCPGDSCIVAHRVMVDRSPPSGPGPPHPFGLGSPALGRHPLPAAGADDAMDAAVGAAAGLADQRLPGSAEALPFAPAALAVSVGEGHGVGW